MLVANKKDQRHLRTVLQDEIDQLCKEFDLKGAVNQEIRVMQAEVENPNPRPNYPFLSSLNFHRVVCFLRFPR